MGNLVEKFQEYSDWRDAVLTMLERYQTGLAAADLSDAAGNERLLRMREKLAGDKVSIAFVAEFSRGKSELINAIFFAGYGQRILPSSPGRTTMCPTELQHDEMLPPSIRLLPIETRAQPRSVADFKAEKDGSAWVTVPLDIASVDAMREAFRQVSLSHHVSLDEAKSYGLYDEDDPDAGFAVSDGMVEIPKWRHAIVNFPHPLLRNGLVIIDTPGLNAIGTEPELTLNLIPNADAVLYVLAADTGVTKNDIEVWRTHIGAQAGHVVVLNKIDSMWDELRSPAEIEEQIAKQSASVAQKLGLSAQQVFPVSALKGLIGKINADAEVLAKSRLQELEDALSHELIPARQALLRTQLASGIDALAAAKSELLATRLRSIAGQVGELNSLRGKNANIMMAMMDRIEVEQKAFDASLLRLQGTRAVFSRLAGSLFAGIGRDMLNRETRRAREAMEKSRFTSGMRQAVKEFFEQIGAALTQADEHADEIARMMSAMYRKFADEHGLSLSAPAQFSFEKYHQEIGEIEAIYQKQFSFSAVLTTPQVFLMRKFFDSIATRVRECMAAANGEADAWLKAVMAPLESQILEHRKQLGQRKQSIERIHAAIDSLEGKVHLLEKTQADLARLGTSLAQLEQDLKTLLESQAAPMKAAA